MTTGRQRNATGIGKQRNANTGKQRNAEGVKTPKNEHKITRPRPVKKVALDSIEVATLRVTNQKNTLKSMGRKCAEIVAQIAARVALDIHSEEKNRPSSARAPESSTPTAERPASAGAKPEEQKKPRAFNLFEEPQLTIDCMNLSTGHDFREAVDSEEQKKVIKTSKEILNKTRYELSCVEMKNRRLIDGTYEIDKYGEVCDVEIKHPCVNIQCANAENVATESSDFPFNAQYCSIILGSDTENPFKKLTSEYLHRSSDNMLDINKCSRIAEEVDRITSDISSFENTCRDPKCFNTSRYKISQCNINSRRTETDDKNFRISVYRTLATATRIISNNDGLQQNIPLFEEIIIQLETINTMKPNTQGNDKEEHPAYQNTETCLIFNASYHSSTQIDKNISWHHFFGENAFSVAFYDKKNYNSQDKSEAIALSAGYVVKQLENIEHQKKISHDNAIEFFKNIFYGHKEIKDIVKNRSRETCLSDNDYQFFVSNSFLKRQNAHRILSIKEAHGIPSIKESVEDHETFQVQLWSSGPTFGILVIRPFSNAMMQYVFIQTFNPEKTQSRPSSVISGGGRPLSNTSRSSSAQVYRMPSEDISDVVRQTLSRPPARQFSGPDQRVSGIEERQDSFGQRQRHRDTDWSGLSDTVRQNGRRINRGGQSIRNLTPDRLGDEEFLMDEEGSRQFHSRRSNEIHEGDPEEAERLKKIMSRRESQTSQPNGVRDLEEGRKFNSKYQDSTLPLELELELNEL